VPKGATRAVGQRQARAVSASTGRRWQWRWAARLARGGEAKGLLYAARRVQGDEGVTAEMLAVLRRRHRRRTAGPRHARAYGGADLGAPRAGCVGARGLGLRVPRAVRASGRAGAGVRRRCAPAAAGFYFAGAVLEIAKLQFFVQKLTK
jgi:hypothetical protein